MQTIELSRPRALVVAAACAAGAAAAITLLAGSQLPVAAAALLLDGAFVACWLAANWGIGSQILRGFRLRFRGNLLPAVLATSLGLGALSIATLVIGLVGFLNRATAWGMIIAGSIAAIVRLAPRLRTWRVKNERVSPLAWLWVAACVAAGIVGFAGLVPPGLLWGDEPHGYDVAEYHLQVPREWYEAGRVTPLKHNVFSYFPFNVEMHYLLAMHLRGGPWDSMYLAQLMHAAMMALAVAGVFAILRELGSSTAIPAAVMLATTPWILLLAPIAYNEGGMLMYGALAVGMALLAMRETNQRVRVTLLAGVMAGLACGVKLTAIPMILIATAVPLAFVSFRLAMWLVLGAAIALSPWLVRNTVWTGNPFFPEASAILGHGHFSPQQVERWDRAHSPRADQKAPEARLASAWQQIGRDWRFGFLILPIGLASAALARSRESRFLLAVLAVMGISWLFLTHLQGRFFVSALPVCALLLGLIKSGKSAAWAAGAAALAAIIGIGLVLARLHELARRLPLEQIITLRQLDGLTPLDTSHLPRDAHVVLVGDARAFWYGLPMSRLHYRTVFDVDVAEGQTIIDAWRAGTESLPAPVAEVIDPQELNRFARTYFGIPAPPPDIAARSSAYVHWRQ